MMTFSIKSGLSQSATTLIKTSLPIFCVITAYCRTMRFVKSSSSSVSADKYSVTTSLKRCKKLEMRPVKTTTPSTSWETWCARIRGFTLRRSFNETSTETVHSTSMASTQAWCNWWIRDWSSTWQRRRSQPCLNLPRWPGCSAMLILWLRSMTRYWPSSKRWFPTSR